MTQVTLPKLNQSGTNEWADVQDNDVALRDVINGGLDNSNLSGSAGITDANLASPNNSVYRTLLWGASRVALDEGAGTLVLAGSGNAAEVSSGDNVIASGVTPPPLIYFDNDDYTVASKTQKLRVRAQVLTNATAPAITFTVGLYPVTVAGGADALTFTLGSVVSGSTVAIASPSSSSVTQGNSGDLTIPSDGAYALGVVLSGTQANNSAVLVYGYLQTRHV